MNHEAASRTTTTTQTPRSGACRGRRLKIIQQQVGHSYASTTALYTSVSAGYRSQTLRTMLDTTIAAARARADHEEA